MKLSYSKVERGEKRHLNPSLHDNIHGSAKTKALEKKMHPQVKRMHEQAKEPKMSSHDAVREWKRTGVKPKGLKRVM